MTNMFPRISELTGKTTFDVEVKLAWKRTKLSAKDNVDITASVLSVLSDQNPYSQYVIKGQGGSKDREDPRKHINEFWMRHRSKERVIPISNVIISIAT
ncbi:unnamed protein product [Leptosia nina]|uniref:Uncharacterized protein n=1 Tax=Leptosia nina TaxID=320188 RepID=A0AAV1JYI4_9NEOP